MWFDAILLTILEIVTVAFRIWDRKEVGRDRPAVVDAELFADVVARRPLLCFVAIFQEMAHTVAVWLKHMAIASFRSGARREPKYTVDRIFDTNTLHRDPLSRCGQL